MVSFTKGKKYQCYNVLISANLPQVVVCVLEPSRI